jgi:signal peptidase I
MADRLRPISVPDGHRQLGVAVTAEPVQELVDRPVRRRAGHRRRPRGAVAGVVGVVVLVLAALASQLAGYRALVISSGSMQPLLSVGDLVVSRSTPAGRLHPGDIVTFRDPALGNRFVTHRVVRLTPASGQVTVQTKGDANLVPEQWAVADSATVGLLVTRVPAHGEWLLWLQSGWARIALVSLLCGWLLMISLRRIWAAAL